MRVTFEADAEELEVLGLYESDIKEMIWDFLLGDLDPERAVELDLDLVVTE